MKSLTYVFCLTICFISFGQSKIDKSKKELNDSLKNQNQKNNNKNIRHSHQQHEDKDNCNWLNIAFGIFKYGLIGDYNNEDHLDNNLTDYPYYNNESGNYEDYSVSDADSLKKDFRLDVENHLLFNSNVLYGNHLKVKIRPIYFLYAQTEFHQVYEKNNLNKETDRLTILFFNLG